MTNEIAFLLLFYITILFGNAYFVIYNTKILSTAHENERGEMSGMMSGLQSIVMFLGPLI